jgi:membrane-associated phospholipid phosphatase
MRRMMAFALMVGLLHSTKAQQVDERHEPLSIRQTLLRGTTATLAGGGAYLLYRHAARVPATTQVDFAAYQRLSRYRRQFVRSENQAAVLRSDMALYGTLLLPVAELAFHRGYFLTEMTHYGESLMGALAITYVLKTVFTSPRPYAYQRGIEIEMRLLDQASGASFSSGHAALAFAAAGHLLWQERLHWSLPAIGMGLATTTAVVRVQSGKHFPHDVIAGAAIGLGTSYLVHRLRRKGRTWVAPLPGTGVAFGAVWGF